MTFFDLLKPRSDELVELDAKLTSDVLTKRAVSGIVILVFRRLGIQAILAFSTIFLAKILFPEAFGAFAIMVFIVEFLALLPSQGFVGAIIQKKEKVSQKETSAVFWMTLVLSLILLVMLWSAAPLISTFYQGRIDNGVILIRILAMAILMINIKLISLSILERQLKYLRLTIIESTELLITQGIAVLLALYGFGVESLVVGYLIGKSFGALAAYFLGPLRVSFYFSFRVFRELVPFAFQFQIYSLANSISGAVAPVYVGRVVGTAGVGYLNWAGGIGLLPWAFAELISRISFPLFSRAQKNKTFFSEVLDKAVDLSLMVTLPFLSILFVFATPITEIIYAPKWLPAVWALRFFVLLGAFQAMAIVATSALLGLGQVKFVRNVTLISAGVFWVLALILVPKFGFIAQPLAWAAGSVLQLATVLKIKNLVKVDYWQKFLIYWFFSIISVFLVYFVIPVKSLRDLVLDFIFVLLIYGFLVFVFRRPYLKFFWRQCWSFFR